MLQEFYHTGRDVNPEDEKLRIIRAAAQIIKIDIKSCLPNEDFYPTNEVIVEMAGKLLYLPLSLKLLLEILFVGKDTKLKQSSIGQAIMKAVRPRVLLPSLQLVLGVQMHHHFASRFLVDTLNQLGFSSSYHEVLKYEGSAAISEGVQFPDFFPG